MNTSTLAIGTKVRRLAASSDYTNGRTGEIVDVNRLTQRYRVMWTAGADGSPLKVRTWVRFNVVAAL